MIGIERANEQVRLDLDELRAQLTPNQRQILTLVWKHYLEHDALPGGGWISDRELYFEFGNRKTIVVDTLRQPPISGSVIVEQGYGSPCSYQLTPLGVLLTDSGQELENHLVSYLAYIKERCSADPRLRDILAAELQQPLGLSPEQLYALCKLIQLSSWFWGGGGGNRERFQIVVPQNISEILEIDDLRAYVRQTALRNYDPDLPIDEQGRLTYSSRRARQRLTASESAPPVLPGIGEDPRQSRSDERTTAMATEKLVGVASRVKTPLALAGVVVAMLYLLYRQVLSLNVFANIGANPTFLLLQDVVNKLFILALVAIVLGVASYLLPILTRRH